MANMLKLVAVGHPSTNDPNKVHPLVAAGLGYHAHAANPQGLEAEVIDRGSQVVSDVHRTASEEFPHVVTTPIAHSISGSGHTWTTIEQKAQALDHLVIPYADEVTGLGHSVFQGRLIQ